MATLSFLKLIMYIVRNNSFGVLLVLGRAVLLDRNRVLHFGDFFGVLFLG